MKSCLKYVTAILSFFSFFFLTSKIHAAEGISYSNLEEQIGSISFTSIVISTLLMLSFAAISLSIKPLKTSQKKLLFICIGAVAILQTLFLAGSTIYVNVISYSNGPVHYHADIEVYNCGEKVDFLDPTGLSNRIGTSTLHEHNDGRIHLEGVVVEKEDQSLGKFFHVIGGNITPESVALPTTNGELSLTNGQTCPDGTPGSLSVFVYKSINGSYVQQKVSDPANYIYAPESQVPAGDCIIIEFGSAKTSTENICTSYRVAEEIGKIKNGGMLNN